MIRGSKRNPVPLDVHRMLGQHLRDMVAPIVAIYEDVEPYLQSKHDRAKILWIAIVLRELRWGLSRLCKRHHPEIDPQKYYFKSTLERRLDETVRTVRGNR